jgi:hypothetical protein
MLTSQKTRTEKTIYYGMRNYVYLLRGFQATRWELLSYSMGIMIGGNKI